MVVLCATEHIFNETATQARTLASKRQAKAIKASHGPRVSPQSQAEEKVMENAPEGSFGQAKVRSKFPKAQATVKHWKRVSQILKTGNPKLARKIRNQFRWDRFVSLRRHWFMRNGALMKGITTWVWMIGIMTRVVLDGMKTTKGYVAQLQAHFHLKAQKGWQRTGTPDLQVTRSWWNLIEKE